MGIRLLWDPSLGGAGDTPKMSDMCPPLTTCKQAVAPQLHTCLCSHPEPVLTENTEIGGSIALDLSPALFLRTTWPWALASLDRFPLCKRYCSHGWDRRWGRTEGQGQPSDDLLHLSLWIRWSVSHLSLTLKAFSQARASVTPRVTEESVWSSIPPPGILKTNESAHPGAGEVPQQPAVLAAVA